MHEMLTSTNHNVSNKTNVTTSKHLTWKSMQKALAPMSNSMIDKNNQCTT